MPTVLSSRRPPAGLADSPPSRLIFDIWRPDDAYVRIKDLLWLRRAHFPGTEFAPLRPRCDEPDACWVIPSAAVRHFSVGDPLGCTSLTAIQLGFKRLRAFKREQGKSLHRAPYGAEMIFAPVKVLIAERDEPIRVAVTDAPIYPVRAKFGICKANAGPIWAYVSAALLNSVYGQAYYRRALRQGNPHRPRAADGVSMRALLELPVAHREAQPEAVERVAELAYRAILIRSAARELRFDPHPQLGAVCEWLAYAVSRLLQLSEPEDSALRREVSDISLLDSEQPSLFPLYDGMPPVPPIRLPEPGGSAPEIRRWEARINRPLLDQVSREWLWSPPQGYLRFLSSDDDKGPGDNLRGGTSAMSSPELAIMHDPRRCAGHPTVGLSRITVHDIVALAKLYGWNLDLMRTEEGLSASPEQIRAAVEYYWEHQSEIDAILDERRSDYERGLLGLGGSRED